MKNETEITNNVLLYFNEMREKKLKSTNNWYWAICAEHLNFVVPVHLPNVFFYSDAPATHKRVHCVVFYFVTFPFYASNSIYSGLKYVWKKRYSFLFFGFYCTKNVNSQNATTSKIYKACQCWKRALLCTDTHSRDAMWLLCILLNQTTEFC